MCSKRRIPYQQRQIRDQIVNLQLTLCNAQNALILLSGHNVGADLVEMNSCSINFYHRNSSSYTQNVCDLRSVERALIPCCTYEIGIEVAKYPMETCSRCGCVPALLGIPLPPIAVTFLATARIEVGPS